MPQGTIDSFDADAHEGRITPDGGGEPLPFSVDDVADRKTGELVQPGEAVTYEEEQGRAVRIHRAAGSGYV